jgi:hypothetical protein
MAHKDTREIRVDLELNRAAIAFPGSHPVFPLRYQTEAVISDLAGTL